jgi:hypothetical protein
MITVATKLESLTNIDNSLIFYPSVFGDAVVNDVTTNLANDPDGVLLCLTVGLAYITEKCFRPKYYDKQPGTIACVFLNDHKAREGIFPKGSVLLIGANMRYYTQALPKECVKLYEETFLPYVFPTIQERLVYSQLVKKDLKDVLRKPMWEQCVPISDLVELGKGCYGSVYKTKQGPEYAVKFSKVKPETYTAKDVSASSSWHEVYILGDIIRPIIEKKICPNLPLLYNVLTCKKKEGAIITTMELASGDLKQYLLSEEKISQEEAMSCIFQIFAGLHAIQMNGQIMNFDVKKENILYYNIKPGGYWHYKILGKDFYVPNTGKLFVLNDFGISRSMSPYFPMYKTDEDKTFRLGSRYAVLYNGAFVPIHSTLQYNHDEEKVEPNKITWEDDTTSYGAEFRLSRSNGKVLPVEISVPDNVTSYLKKVGIPLNVGSYKFYTRPDIIPPFEFFNDTQDAVRMFVGGKRTTQKGNHRVYGAFPKNILSQLKRYVYKAENLKAGTLPKDPSKVLAGQFLLSFFGEESEMRKKPKGVMLESYGEK